MNLRINWVRVRDCIFAFLIAILISVINYYFLVPTNYSYAIPMFFIFFMFEILFFEYLGRYRNAKDNKKKEAAYFFALITASIVALESTLVAFGRVSMDGIKWIALLIAMISWTIFLTLTLNCKPKDLENT